MTKRLLWLGLKGLVTGLLGWVVLRLVDPEKLRQALSDMGPLAIALAVALTVASVLVSAWRWKRVLAHLGERVSFGALVADTLVGTTYNLILPTSVGGDVARGARCAKRVKHPEHAWASVAFERIIGLLSLVLVSSIGLLSGVTEGTRQLLFAALGLAALLVLLLVFLPHPLRLAARLPQTGPRKRLRQALEQLAGAFSGPLANRGPRLETLGWSILYQFVALGILIPVASGWQEPRLVEGVFLGIPVALVASILPITIGGFGLRENLFVAVLAPFGISPDRALVLSLAWVCSNILVALLGLGVLLKERS